MSERLIDIDIVEVLVRDWRCHVPSRLWMASAQVEIPDVRGASHIQEMTALFRPEDFGGGLESWTKVWLEEVGDPATGLRLHAQTGWAHTSRQGDRIAHDLGMHIVAAMEKAHAVGEAA